MNSNNQSGLFLRTITSWQLIFFESPNSGPCSANDIKKHTVSLQEHVLQSKQLVSKKLSLEAALSTIKCFQIVHKQ